MLAVELLHSNTHMTAVVDLPHEFIHLVDGRKMPRRQEALEVAQLRSMLWTRLRDSPLSRSKDGPCLAQLFLS